jgi:ABC-type amino acid transport substrate-binding protein
MLKKTPIAILCGCVCAASLHAAQPTFAAVTNNPARANTATPDTAEKPFTFKDATGKAISVPMVDASAQRKLVAPIAKVDPRLSVTLVKAANIAQERAYAHSKSRCWRYVKEALLAAGAVDSYPKTALAKQAANELVQDYGFTKLPVSDPYAAPIGAVLVYGGKGAGHVEIRNKTGFVSDFRAAIPSKRKLIGVFAKA